ncbi:hypothetical protein AB0A71_28820 [Kitasatospora aureofaciens]|uniref:hypothetical protein n=1 Tax=Kitasatospora aureofaciens TaxID=1894 RepID=UPI0033C89743
MTTGGTERARRTSPAGPPLGDNFLANSDRFDFDPRTGPISAPPGGPPTTGELRPGGVPVAVGLRHSTGCRSALIPELPGRQGHVIATAPDEHGDAVTDPVLRPPADFPSVSRPGMA